MNKQVLVRTKLLNGNNRMLRCEVLAEANGKLRCKCEGESKVREVNASEAVPAQQVFGSASPLPGAPVLQKAYPASVNALGNMIQKK